MTYKYWMSENDWEYRIPIIIESPIKPLLETTAGDKLGWGKETTMIIGDVRIKFQEEIVERHEETPFDVAKKRANEKRNRCESDSKH